MIARLARAAVPAALVLGTVGFATPAHADVDSDIAALKKATEKYKDVKAALADGYMKDDMCVSSPDGKGVMGYHYVNPKLMGPQNITKPPILLYQPDGDGGRKLVAVEYFQVDKDQDLKTSDDKPTLFGKPFDGPMEGHNPEMPKHYDLHAWVWQDNPQGVFAQYNPAGSCKGAEPVADAKESGAKESGSTGAHGKGQVSTVPSGGAETGGGFASTGGGVENMWLFALGAGALVAGGGVLKNGRRVAARKR